MEQLKSHGRLVLVNPNSSQTVMYELIVSGRRMLCASERGLYRFEFWAADDPTGTPIGSPGYDDPKTKRQHVDLRALEEELESRNYVVVREDQPPPSLTVSRLLRSRKIQFLLLRE